MKYLKKWISNSGAYSGGGVMEAKPPQDQWNLLISGGFQPPTGAEPPPGKIKKFKPPLDKFLNTPLIKLHGFTQQNKMEIFDCFLRRNRNNTNIRITTYIKCDLIWTCQKHVEWPWILSNIRWSRINRLFFLFIYKLLLKRKII